MDVVDQHWRNVRLSKKYLIEKDIIFNIFSAIVATKPYTERRAQAAYNALVSLGHNIRAIGG